MRVALLTSAACRSQIREMRYVGCAFSKRLLVHCRGSARSPDLQPAESLQGPYDAICTGGACSEALLAHMHCRSRLFIGR